MLRPMRRLTLVVSVTVFADTMLFSAIVPLIPYFTDAYELSTLAAGILVASYGAGAVLAGIPSGLLAARIGPKRTVVIGLLVLAVATLAFSVDTSALGLALARFAQGVASAITWSGALAWLMLATPRDQRGRTVGLIFGVAVLGFIVGPAVGALAELGSIRATFIAIAVVTALVAVFAASFPAGRSDAPPAGALRRTLRSTDFLSAVWLVTVPSLFFGVIDLLVPLSLDEAGWGTIAIAGTFIVAGSIEVVLAPRIGGFSDRRGRLVPVRAGLILLGVIGLAFALLDSPYLVAGLVTCASVAASLIFSPSAALISDRAEIAQIPQTLAFGFMNTAWAAGVMLGPALGGAIADTFGDAVPYLFGGALAIATLSWLHRLTPAASAGTQTVAE